MALQSDPSVANSLTRVLVLAQTRVHRSRIVSDVVSEATRTSNVNRSDRITSDPLHSHASQDQRPTAAADDDEVRANAADSIIT